MSKLWKPVASIWAEGTPRPRRAKQGRVVGKGRHRFVQMYTPESSAATTWTQIVTAAALGRRPMQPFEGPVRLSWTAYFARTKEMTVARYGSGPIPKINTPDEDNLNKIVADVLTKLGFWHDDGQMWGGPREKYYCGISGKPGMQIELAVMEEQPALLGGVAS